ncbi:hypothetical protein C8R44DRAFT_819509 [Mycena epipterygia]|nr:hypothetical protein C8R44DRAFT_819509 [Mycena epipterygia]
MASSSNDIDAMTATPFSSAGDMKYHLQSLLDSKEKQLQQAGTLGQRILAQQMELEERIRQLQEIDADKLDEDRVDDDARDRYRELAETLTAWDRENADLSTALVSRGPGPSSPGPSSPPPSPPGASTGPKTLAAQSRRAKNAAHRADDVEFAFEIGSGLLTEVRRLQSMLNERDKEIQGLHVALRQEEASAGKYKEENRSLEVTLQELRSQLSAATCCSIDLASSPDGDESGRESCLDTEDYVLIKPCSRSLQSEENGCRCGV